jgi:hypothetical protein
MYISYNRITNQQFKNATIAPYHTL